MMYYDISEPFLFFLFVSYELSLSLFLRCTKIEKFTGKRIRRAKSNFQVQNEALKKWKNGGYGKKKKENGKTRVSSKGENEEKEEIKER